MAYTYARRDDGFLFRFDNYDRMRDYCDRHDETIGQTMVPISRAMFTSYKRRDYKTPHWLRSDAPNAKGVAILAN